jgi:hypothetical protein
VIFVVNDNNSLLSNAACSRSAAMRIFQDGAQVACEGRLGDMQVTVTVGHVGAGRQDNGMDARAIPNDRIHTF